MSSHFATRVVAELHDAHPHKIDLAAYSLATDWDINQVWAVISPFLQKYGRAKISDLEKLIGSHISEKRLRSYLDTLRKEGQITTEGKNKYMYYVLAKGE